MEIRHSSKTGRVAPPLAELPATLTQQIDDLKQRWLARLNQDPASFAQIEVEIHDRFRRLADQMTASLLAEATITADRAEPERKGGQATAAPRDAQRRRDG